MIARYRGGSLTAVEVAPELAEAIGAVASGVPADLDGWDITNALERIWTLVRRLNRYVEEQRPWELAKDEARADDLDRVLYGLADGLRAAAVALSAYLPETAPKILEALRQPGDLGWEEVAAGRARAVDGIEAAQPLFPRVEQAPAAA